SYSGLSSGSGPRRRCSSTRSRTSSRPRRDGLRASRPRRTYRAGEGARRAAARRRASARAAPASMRRAKARSLTEALHLAVTEAGDEVVVHHPHSLHEGITDGRPDKAEATLDERRAHRIRLTRPGGEIPQRASTVLLRRPTHEAPEKVAERAVAFLEVEEGPGVADRGIHFLAIADDPRILQKLRDLLAIVAGYTLGVEPVERLEETGALVQDDPPGEPGLEAIEHELREQVPVAVERYAPLLVVIREHQRVVTARPAAPDHGTILHGILGKKVRGIVHRAPPRGQPGATLHRCVTSGWSRSRAATSPHCQKWPSQRPRAAKCSSGSRHPG